MAFSRILRSEFLTKSLCVFAMVLISMLLSSLSTSCNFAAEAIPNEIPLTQAPEKMDLEKPPPVMVTKNASRDIVLDSPLTDAEFEASSDMDIGLDIEFQSTDSVAMAVASTPTPKPEPTLVGTAMPTFTPPVAPEASAAEHFWLHRPVPEGSAVWTDKAYPYGNNRGGSLRTHHGVEFNVAAGTEVLATANGTVIVAGPDIEQRLGAFEGFYGNVIVIKHDSGLGSKPVFTLYGHLSEILVAVGQEVRARETIALSGSSGVADGAHLHFEIRVGENSYEATRNPLLWLYPFPERGAVAGRITYSNGESAFSFPLTLRRIDGPSAYAATTTYADTGVNPDEYWAENFVFDDVVAGYYELSAGVGEQQKKAEFWVYPYQTTFVELVVGN